MRAVAALAAALALASPALAGDSARLNALGFSPDGAIFAFEQFGVQDGSGFPYSEVFAVDMKQDAWLPGTPIRVRLDSETATVTAARAQALGMAQPLLHQARIGGNMEVLAHDPETEVTPARTRMSFDLTPWDGARGGIYDVQLEDITFPGRANCPSEDGKLHGFRLTLSESDSGRVLAAHADSAVPGSRGCPLGYELEMVARPEGSGDRYVAVVAVKSLGFEGPDRRFLAVPLFLPAGAN